MSFSKDSPEFDYSPIRQLNNNGAIRQMLKELNMTRVFRVIIICMLANWTSTGYAGGSSSNVSSGCATVEFMAKMVALNIMFPHFRDSYSALQDMRLALEELNFLVCQPVILTANTRYDSRYSNHTLISTDLYDDAWYFPNGQLFMLAVGEDVSVY